ncbi:hypothetical protein AYO45_01965 [Gammaproteobacteria bacterium SCGC AG-212-F23]|nr:hypothetical protein AYO45_01965 [Gammaproteobacteria bacterium SCGC AG-212-F23]
MKNILIISLVLVFLSGCTTESFQNEPFFSANEISVKPHLVQVQVRKTDAHLMYGNDPALERAFNQYATSGKAPNIVTEGFVKFAYNAAQQPIVKATPFQEVVVSLEPGEKFTNVTSGDPSRWSYAAAVSGSGLSQQQNILIKPALPNLSTNMVITTNKRIYNLKLVSSMDASATKSVSFWYPDEMVNAINNEDVTTENNPTIASVPNVNLNTLNFSYQIGSDGFFKPMPSWKPTRVFDDGSHTYIQFPGDISNKDMPVLFVINGSNKEVVNYRSKPPYFVVDKIFNKAALVMGVGQSQSTVIITNHCYR